MVRARFCEIALPPKSLTAIQTCFSWVAFDDGRHSGNPMSQVLDNVPIDQETKNLLLGGASRLRPFYQLMLAQESGEWKTPANSPANFIWAIGDVAGAYWQAMQWAREVSGGVKAPQVVGRRSLAKPTAQSSRTTNDQTTDDCLCPSKPTWAILANAFSCSCCISSGDISRVWVASDTCP